MSLTVVVTGATGLLGRAVVEAFRGSAKIVALVHKRTLANENEITSIACDLCTDDLVSLLTPHAPDVIIHCAAERRPDAFVSASADANALNIDASARLAHAAEHFHAWLLYLSTDYVFDGTNPPYNAISPTNPLNAYGLSKLAGEQAIRAILSDVGILRVGVLYSDDVESLGESAVTAVLEAITAGGTVEMDNWGIRRPTHVKDVALALKGLVLRKQRFSDFRGTFLLNGEEAVTKFEMAKMFARLAGIEVTLVSNDNPPTGAPRPKDTDMDCSALKLMGLAHHTPLEEGFQAVVDHWKASLKQ